MGKIDAANVAGTPKLTTRTVEKPLKAAAPAPAPKPRPTSDFAAPQKKLVNTTGRHPPVTPKNAPPELKAAVAAARALLQTGKQIANAVAPMIPPPDVTTSYGVSARFGKASASGKISAAQWKDPTQIVGNLTQYPATGKTKQSEAACSAANMIGAALMSGGAPAASKLLSKVAAATSQLNPAERTELNGISDRIKNKTATFADLNRAQELVYRSANTAVGVGDLRDQALGSGKLNPREQKELFDTLSRYVNASVMSRDEKDAARVNVLLSKGLGSPVDITTADSDGMMDVGEARRGSDTSGMTDAELLRLGETAAGARSQSVGDNPSIEALAATLQPGEALTMRISGGPDPRNPKAAEAADHYVTIGRREDGRLYVYNPDPAKGDATLVLGGQRPDPAFLKATAQYDDRFINDGDKLPDGIKYKP